MLIAEYWTDVELLKEALERAPEMTIDEEEEYLVDGTASFLFWAEGGDFDSFEAGLEDDPTVASVKQITDVETRRLYRVRTTERGHQATTFQLWSELDLVLLELEGTVDGWTVRMRFPDREAFARNRRGVKERGRPFELLALYHETAAASPAETKVTADQSEALVAAYESGYFDVPRTTSQSELAEQLDISSQSLSERLRRGTATLVEATLT